MARELLLPFRALEEVVIMACDRWVTWKVCGWLKGMFQ